MLNLTIHTYSHFTLVLLIVLKVKIHALTRVILFSLMNEVVHTSPTIGSNVEEVSQCPTYNCV